MLKIGDFSRVAQVSVRALRLYDEMGLLKPAEIDRFTDYRYYSLDQLPTLNRILALKDLGLALDQIKQLMRRDLPIEQLEGMLLMKQQDLERSVREDQARLQRVAARLRLLRDDPAPAYDVLQKNTQALWIAGRRAVIPTLDDMATLRCSLYTDIAETFAALRLTPGEPELAIYHLEEYSEENIDTEAAVGVDEATRRRLDGGPLQVRELPAAPLVATLVHHGPAMDIPAAVTSLFRWIGANALSSAGPLREAHLDFHESAHDFIQPVTVELQLPVAE
jgi:DNA-binding transcriptional MerR regulator/effector-binding domain-containing protein